MGFMKFQRLYETTLNFRRHSSLRHRFKAQPAITGGLYPDGGVA
jgi:hypothetical protein